MICITILVKWVGPGSLKLKNRNTVKKDFFEFYEELPPKPRAVLEKYSLEDMTYESCASMLEEMEALGYTFEYYLDAVPYDLRKMPTIDTLKQGDYFKLKESSSVVYVRGSYCQSSKKYEAHKFDDICHFIYKKKGTQVFTDFEF